MRLAYLSSQALFLIGFFSVLTGYFLFRLLGKTKWGRKNEVLTRVFPFVFCFVVAVFSFDSRAVQLLLQSPQTLANAGIRYCPGGEVTRSAEVEEKKPGCELIYRAYELKIIKDLGSCASTQLSETGEVCNLRQRDEPLLHYSARLFSDFLIGLKKQWDVPNLNEKIRTTFERQLEHTDALIGKLRHVVMSAPKSSHHVFTNLPYPEGAVQFYFEKWFRPRTCTNQFKSSGTKSESQVFEQTLADLFYDSCLEYTIHWNSPLDICQKISSSPASVAAELGIAGDLKTVIKRTEEQKAYHRLKYQLIFLPVLNALHPVPPSAADIEKVIPQVGADLAPQQVISFQCFMKSKDGGEIKSLLFDLYSYRFEARVSYFSKDFDKTALLKNLSQLLAPGFNYSGFISNEDSLSSVMNAAPVNSQSFEDGAYPFARLEALKGVDIFLDHSWLHERADLLEIYPYSHHLSNFVENFKLQYHPQRTKL